jgi:hypothetical protein
MWLAWNLTQDGTRRESNEQICQVYPVIRPWKNRNATRKVENGNTRTGCPAHCFATNGDDLPKGGKSATLGPVIFFSVYNLNDHQL